MPHDAAGFFALTEPIDRKELKRAYNRLIRRYKPERAPEEFQRIRAAYEQLDERLRYGESAAQAPTAQVRWSGQDGDAADRNEVVAQPRDAAPKPPPAPGVAQRLEAEEPAALYAELREKPHKSPFDYYALALLADVVEPKAPLKFAEWLLAGVSAHPRDGALARLLHEYVRGPLPAGAAERLLPAIAKAVSTDAYYELTEPLWRTVLREQGTAKFAALLTQCQRHINDHRIAGRMVFTIGMTRAAMLLGDDPWTEEAVEFIDRNFEQIPPWLEQDVDQLGLLRDYARVRAKFVSRAPLRGQLDTALRDYFSEEQQVGDRSVVACQVAIASDLDALAEAFPLEENDLYAVFWPLWSWVSWDVAERHAPTNVEGAHALDWSGRITQLIQLASKNGFTFFGSFAWQALGMMSQSIAAAASLALVVAGFVVFESISNSWGEHLPVWLGILSWIGLISGAGACYLYVFGITSRLIFEPYRKRKTEQQYKVNWRPAILRFVHRVQMDDQVFRLQFADAARIDIPMAVDINTLVQQDYALPMLSTAQRFLA